MRAYLQFALASPVVIGMAPPEAWLVIAPKSQPQHVQADCRRGGCCVFLFSVVALLFPEIFPESFRGQGEAVNLYFEAVITALVLLVQVLELRARTGPAAQSKPWSDWLRGPPESFAAGTSSTCRSIK